MKKIYLFLAIFIIPLLIFGQSKDEVTIGNGTATSYKTPWNTYYNYSYSQLIYTAAEIGIGSEGALITSLKFYYNGYSDYSWDNMVIYMSHTTKSTFSSTSDWESFGNLTEVFNGSVNVSQGSASWVTITLVNPFIYNGTDNFLIAIDNNHGGYISSNAKFYYTSTSGTGYQVLHGYSDSSNPDPENPPSGTRDYSRSNIKINYITDADPMEYSSCTTSSTSTSDVFIGSTDNEVIKLNVETTGYLSPLSATSITFNTNGTTNSSDITNAKVYVTSGEEFSTSNQFGSSISNPSGSMTFTGNATLGNGSTYFWLAYDIASGATLENVVDGQCTAVTVDGTERTPSITNPSGNRTIDALKYAGGSGTEGDPYRISRLKDLSELCQTNADWSGSKYFILTNNINATQTQYWDDVDDNSDGDLFNDPNDLTSSGNNEGWPSIGPNWGGWFSGHIDGQSYEIDGIHMNRDNSFYAAGFIGVFYDGATLENLGITNVNIDSEVGYLGGLCGYTSGNSITNCYVTGQITSSVSGTIGGLIGRLQSSTDITNCYTSCDVTYNATGYSLVGGFAGYTQSNFTINNCFSEGEIYNSSPNGMVGGFTGRLEGPANNCYHIGDVYGNTYWAGCFDGYASGTATNCFTVGNYYLTNGNTAPTNKGFRHGGTNNNNFWDIDASNQLTATGASAKTTLDMKTQSTFTDAGWDFSSIWTIDPSVNDGYPYLIGMEPPLPTVIWDGSSSNDWNTAANWNGNAIPTSGDNVVIANAGGSLPILESGETADCYNLTVYSDATLTIESGGSLITAGNITNSGTINVSRSISNGQWHLISSPVAGAQSGMFSGDYLQNWEEPSHTWLEISSTTEALTAAKGFGFWSDGTGSETHNFSGTPHTGNQSKALTFTEYSSDPNAYEGSNLLGNPYPSSIDWSGLDNTYGAIYYLKSDGTYDNWNNGSGTGAATQYVAPAQGFFIITTANGTFNVANSDRTHQGATSFYKATNKITNGLLLKTQNGELSDELWIAFNEASTGLFDFTYDAYQLFSGNNGISHLYSFAGEKKLSIDIRPETETIQLGFKNNESGVYKIGIKEMDGLAKTILEDTKTETLHNLQNSDYEFSWDIGDAETRFILHLKATGLGDIETSISHIFAYEKTIYIRSSEKLNNAQISIIDMMGRVVYESRLVDGQNEQITAPVKDGVYMIQLISHEGTQVEKVILR